MQNTNLIVYSFICIAISIGLAILTKKEVIKRDIFQAMGYAILSICCAIIGGCAFINIFFT